MTLDPAYLTYPRRAHGMDHDLYQWSNLFDRVPMAWPGGASLAATVVISLEWFPIIPSDKPFRAPGHMQTAYPDFRHYTAREYGTRVGIYRILDSLAACGIRASVATNSVLAERYPSLLRDIVAAGHEVVAHATDMNATIATGVAEDDERAIIRTSLDTLERTTGVRPSGWLSIARSQSWNTPRLLAEEGVRYMLDWVNDELPYRMTTASGDIVNVPLNHELSDRQIITTQQHSAESYRTQIEDAADWLIAEAQNHGGRMLPLHITPYIMGLPYRIGALDMLLKGLSERRDLAFLTAGDIAACA
jgi:peptidoglycan/xylan/chitin deacetylase (PgdA/CDA1 family)